MKTLRRRALARLARHLTGGLIAPLLLGLSTQVVSAGELTDAIMAPNLFADATEGEVLRYDHSRLLPGLPAGQELPGVAKGLPIPKAVVDGHVALARKGGKLALMLSDAGHAPQPAAEFPMAAPNPILLFFLENVVRNMAAQTGGSPFYIRNRIRDALAGAAPEAAGAAPGLAHVTLQPFAADPNRAAMGRFAALEIMLDYDPARPGQLVELKADTGAGADGYSESLKLIPKP